jgi:fructoselysine-6-P-deglycase FrlB-like protein
LVGHGESDAFVASEIPLTRRYDCVLAISRSGTTTEVLRALDVLGEQAATISISAVPDSPVLKAAQHRIVLEFADEKAVVQTRFATTTLALLRAHLGDDVEAAAEDAERALTLSLPFDPRRFEQFVFLGRDWSIALAHEASLKLREAGGAWSEAYPALEYRHGPISLGGPGSAVWCFGAIPADLVDEVVATGATVVQNGLDPLAELVLAQRMAVELAQARGLDPDHPRHLRRSVVLPRTTLVHADLQPGASRP